MDQTTISVLSLIVAGLAVFVGPVVSWQVTKRQLESAERIAQRQVIGPIRQQWIADLRKRLAEVSALSLHYFQAGYEDREDKEYQHLALLGQEITLMLSPDIDEEHKRLLTAIGEMHRALGGGRGHAEKFIDAFDNTIELSRNVLRAEWQRVKHDA